MKEKVIIVAIIVVILVLMVVLLKDALKGKTKETNSFKKKLQNHQSPKTNYVPISNGPIIGVKYPGESDYKEYEVKRVPFTIGSGSKCDLCINNPQVSMKQAVIKRSFEDKGAYFQLINYGRKKENPMEYFNKDYYKEVMERSRKDRKDISNLLFYEYMNYGEEMFLENFEVFYVGDIKLTIRIPSNNHIVGNTEMRAIGKQGNKYTEMSDKALFDYGTAYNSGEKQRSFSTRSVDFNPGKYTV